MQTTVIEKFIAAKERYSDKHAIVYEDKKVTFKELGMLVRCLKENVLKDVFLKRKVVGVLLPKSIELVVSDIAILSCGAAFMNLDYKLPEARIQAIITQVQPSVIITQRKLAEKYKQCFGACRVVCMEDVDFENANVGMGLEDIAIEGIIDTDPFCVINTSGSTGTPKAVALNQLSFFDFMAWTDEVYGFDGTERIGCLTPVYFDIFVFELCLMMFRGSTMVLLDAKYSTFPMELLKKLAAEKISFIFWVPTIMVNIANQNLLDEIVLPDLRRVWFAGEVFPTKQFNYWFDKLPSVQFSNLYGPIEITLDCTYYILTGKFEENDAIPIGYPCRNTDILILNDENEICKALEQGELCVRGSSLALGYYNDFERTQQAFTQNPLNRSFPERIYRTGDLVYQTEDGIIMFVGRKDSLIKHSGYRIELGEIEHILVSKCGIVDNCCAVYPKNVKKIVLFYESENEYSKADFYRALGEYFPKYMFPSVFIKKEKMPQNANGKIDRYALVQEAEQMEIL